MILILDNLRSAQNVGSLFRTADGAGVRHIYLVGITPKPGDMTKLFNTKAEKMLAKTALGAESAVPWTALPDLSSVIEKLRNENCEILGLEEGKDIKSLDYRDWSPKGSGKVALILGSEVDGLSVETQVHLDHIIHLPMRGVKNSLNVAVAGGIALYHLSDTIERLKRKN